MTKKRTKRPTATKPSDETGPVPTVARDPATDVDGQATEDVESEACEEAGAHEGTNNEEAPMSPPFDSASATATIHSADEPRLQVAITVPGEAVEEWREDVERAEARDGGLLPCSACEEEKEEGLGDGGVCLECLGAGVEAAQGLDDPPSHWPRRAGNDVGTAAAALTDFLAGVRLRDVEMPPDLAARVEWWRRHGGEALVALGQDLVSLADALDCAVPSWSPPPRELHGFRIVEAEDGTSHMSVRPHSIAEVDSDAFEALRRLHAYLPVFWRSVAGWQTNTPRRASRKARGAWCVFHHDRVVHFSPVRYDAIDWAIANLGEDPGFILFKAESEERLEALIEHWFTDLRSRQSIRLEAGGTGAQGIPCGRATPTSEAEAAEEGFKELLARLGEDPFVHPERLGWEILKIPQDRWSDLLAGQPAERREAITQQAARWAEKVDR